MWSIEDGAIAEVISAIDQLAEDAGKGLEADEMSARVAAVWGMLSALDPELARLRAAYESPGSRAPRYLRPPGRPEG